MTPGQGRSACCGHAPQRRWAAPRPQGTALPTVSSEAWVSFVHICWGTCDQHSCLLTLIPVTWDSGGVETTPLLNLLFSFLVDSQLKFETRVHSCLFTCQGCAPKRKCWKRGTRGPRGLRKTQCVPSRVGPKVPHWRRVFSPPHEGSQPGLLSRWMWYFFSS